MAGASRAAALKGTLAKLRGRKVVHAALLACAVIAATAAVFLLLGSPPPPVEVEVVGYFQEGVLVDVATVNKTLRIVLRLRGVEEGSSGTLWVLVVQARPGNYDQPVHLAWFPVNLLPNETKVVWTEFTPPDATDGENISEYYIKFYWNWETEPFKEVHGLSVREGENR